MSAGIRAGSSNDGYVQVNGNDIITALSGGNVGIGNTSPSTKLHVNGTVTATKFIGGFDGNSNISVDDWIVHTGDTDTKLGFSAADTISFHTAGAEVLKIGSTGNLELPRNNDYIKIGSGGALSLVHTGSAAFINNSSGFLTHRCDTHQWEKGDGSAEYFRSNATGFAIGHVAPVRRFSVKSSGENAVSMSLLDNNSTNEIWRVGQAADGDGYVEVLEDGGTVGCKLDASGNSFTMGNFGIGIASPNARFNLKLPSRGNAGFRITDSDTTSDVLRAGSQADGDGFFQLRTIAGAGNVLLDASGVSYITGGNFGIGVTSPSTALEVKGDITVYNANNQGDIFFGEHGDVADSKALIRMDQLSSTAGQLEFHTESGGTLEKRVTIASSGQVLIGTTSAGESSADDLTIGNSGHAGMTIRSGTSSWGSFFFSDGTSGGAQYDGAIEYKHNDNYMRFRTAQNEKLRITSDGYVHAGNTGHGTNKVGGQAITNEDFDPYFKLYANTSNHWLMQLRSDTSTGGNGIFLRSGNSSSTYTLYATGYDENNAHLVVRGDGRVGVGTNDPGGRNNGSIDITCNDTTTWSPTSDQRSEASLTLRNNSANTNTFTALHFFNGGGTGSDVTLAAVRKGNMEADFHLMRRINNAGQGQDWRTSVTSRGLSTGPKVIIWAEGTGDNNGDQQCGNHIFESQQMPGFNQYVYWNFKIGSASYSRAGSLRYHCTWSTGHASGSGYQIGTILWINNHSGGGTCDVREHLVYRRRYHNGHHYGWTSAPELEVFQSNNTGTNASIIFRCQGHGSHNSNSYDMSTVVHLHIEHMSVAQNSITPRLERFGTSSVSGTGSVISGDRLGYCTFSDSEPTSTTTDF